MNILNEIKNVMGIQSQSIAQAKKYVTPAFAEAVRAILKCPSKVVVSGVGKSGLVAQKIASTLSSTGTPAIYLHPVEGMHGNLGVLHKNDILLAIGKSGESEELLNILPTVKKIGSKVICITANKTSSLARQSSIVLYFPVKKEACPLNLAPTTSSTLALVVGDALAIALMKLRGFGPEKFALYHPGGLLGKKLLLKVADVMRGGRGNPMVRVTDTMPNLMREIARKWTGAASIVDKKRKLLGLVTDFDIRRAFERGQTISQLSIKKIMNPKPIYVHSDEMATRALEIMESRKKPFTVLPVVDRRKRSVGMIHLHDLVNKGLVTNLDNVL